MPGNAYSIIDHNLRENVRPNKMFAYIFNEYISKNNYEVLDNMLRHWRTNIYFAKRLKILEDIVSIVRSDKYANVNIVNVVLPALIAQIEGIIRDFIKDRDKVIYRRFDMLKERLKGIAEDFNCPEMDVVPLQVIREILLQSSNEGKPLRKSFYFNRHKILHGESCRYGRKEYLVRAFMILDYLNFFTDPNRKEFPINDDCYDEWLS
jgi:hypothetical protein